MKILFVHERFGALAGAEGNAYLTASEFKQRGHVVGIIHGEGTGKAEPAWRDTFSQRYSLVEMRPADQVKRALRDFSPDVIYVHKMADLEVIETLVRSGYPLVRMVHDHDIYCMRSYKYSYFSREICHKPAGLHCLLPCGAFLARNHESGFPLRLISYRQKKREIQLNHNFDRMIVVTEYMKQELLNNGFDSKKIEIHAPVPRMGDAGRPSSFSDRNLILYAGQIIRGKGVDILLRALKKVSTPFECVILGDGSHRAYCEKLSGKLGLAHRVRFEGFVPQEKLKNYYTECTLVAISSVWPEPLATVGLEVMRFGLPVVAFDAGGIKDWLIDGHNGYLVPWMDIDLYAQRIETLLQNKDLARTMGERGKELVNTRYHFERYILGLEEMFLRVIAGHPPAGVRPLPSASSVLAAGLPSGR